MVLGLKPVILLEKLPVVGGGTFVHVILKSLNGVFCQARIRSVTVFPLAKVILPPLVASVAEISVTGVVVIVSDPLGAASSSLEHEIELAISSVIRTIPSDFLMTNAGWGVTNFTDKAWPKAMTLRQENRIKIINDKVEYFFNELLSIKEDT